MGKLNLEGHRFGKLVVQGQVGTNRQGATLWACRCDCGKEGVFVGSVMVGGHRESCGCLKGERTAKRNATHGMTGTPEYNAWVSMKKRCLQEGHKSYAAYGGRGVTICDRWMVFANFYADMGIRPEGTTLERRDTNGNYEPSNCKWATPLEQQNNRRITKRYTYNGETRTITDWCRLKGIKYATAMKRIYKGKSLDDLLGG